MNHGLTVDRDDDNQVCNLHEREKDQSGKAGTHLRSFLPTMKGYLPMASSGLLLLQSKQKKNTSKSSSEDLVKPEANEVGLLREGCVREVSYGRFSRHK